MEALVRGPKLFNQEEIDHQITLQLPFRLLKAQLANNYVTD